MNIPIQELIDAITALTAATERNSAIAQKALGLHLSAASHLPAESLKQFKQWVNPNAESTVLMDTATPETGIPAVDAAPAKKTRAKKSDSVEATVTITGEVSTPEGRKEFTDIVVEAMNVAENLQNAVAAVEATFTPGPEPVVEPEAPTPTPQPTEPPVTVETIRAYIGQYMVPVNTVTGEALEAAQANNAAVTAKVKEINAEFGAARIPDVPTERLAEYLTVLKRWIPLNK